MSEQRAAPMDHERSAPSRHRWIIYGAAFALFALLGGWLVATFAAGSSDAQATAKANELIGRIKDAGLPAPSVDQVTSVLGNDGGVVCSQPESSWRDGTFGAIAATAVSGPGSRVANISRALYTGEAWVLEIYCPDKLDAFKAAVPEPTS